MFIMENKMYKQYLNNQKYCECQLISLWNTVIFFGLDHLVPKINSKKYKLICKKALCIHGGVIRKNFEIERLNLKFIKGVYKLNWIKKHLPVELSIHCHRGYHSILIIDINKNNLTLTNYARNRLHKIKWKSLLDKVNKHINPISWELNNET